MTEEIIKTWKSIALRSAFFGIGFSLILIIVTGGYIWYESRPKPQKPWDNNAIVAFYDYVDTSKNPENKRDEVVFYYTVENKTKTDYSIDSENDILLYAKLDKQKSISGGKPDEHLNIAYPIIIPSNQRFKFPIRLFYVIDSIKEPLSGATKDEKKTYREILEKLIGEELSNLNGFIIYDKRDRYVIDFPAGWKKGNK